LEILVINVQWMNVLGRTISFGPIVSGKNRLEDFLAQDP
jgi:hypothetical protein